LGIVFTGGEAPEPAQSRAIVQEARVQTEVLVCAADSGLFAAEACGEKPSWIIGDMDSLGPGGEGRLGAYSPSKILRYPPDKDYTDTELAISLLYEKGCGRIWIIGGGGGRLDHLFAIRSLFEREQPPERWITPDTDIRCLKSPGKLEAGRGSPISVFPLGEGPWKAASKGLKWPLTGLVWNRGFFGVSNAAVGPFTVYAERGSFMIMLHLDFLPGV
jgi:thiamine pyrophosphokinase